MGITDVLKKGFDKGLGYYWRSFLDRQKGRIGGSPTSMIPCPSLRLCVFALALFPTAVAQSMSKSSVPPSLPPPGVWAAADACGALNPTEVAAALHGSGVVATRSGASAQLKASVCHQKRTAPDRTLDAASFRTAVGPELILIISEPGGAPLVDPKVAAAEPVVPDLGDHASIYTGSLAPLVQGPNGRNGHRLFVTKGSQTFVLLYAPDTVDQQSHDTAVQLAREVLDGEFRGQITSYPIAEQLVTRNKGEVSRHPENVELWNEIGVFSERLEHYDDARLAYLKISQLAPNDPGGYFGVGIANWMSYFEQLTDLAKGKGLGRFDQIAIDPEYADLCNTLRKQHRLTLDEGYESTKKALNLRPDSSDYASYLYLLAKARAQTDCGDLVAVKADGTDADHWVDVVFKNKKVELSSGHRYVSGIEVYYPPPPPPPPPPGGPIPHFVRVAQGVTQGLLIKKVEPNYPPLARQARIQGSVILQAEIGRDGTIQNLSLISGHPMLVSAAIEAVEQWQYKPYLLNGEAVEVETQITVNFSLSGG